MRFLSRKNLAFTSVLPHCQQNIAEVVRPTAEDIHGAAEEGIPGLVADTPEESIHRVAASLGKLLRFEYEM